MDAIFVWVLVNAVLWVGIPVGAFVFLRRFLRAYERRAAMPGELTELRAQLEDLQGKVADLSIENARLQEAQQFTHALRSSEARDASSPWPDGRRS